MSAGILWPAALAVLGALAFPILGTLVASLGFQYQRRVSVLARLDRAFERWGEIRQMLQDLVQNRFEELHTPPELFVRPKPPHAPEVGKALYDIKRRLESIGYKPLPWWEELWVFVGVRLTQATEEYRFGRDPEAGNKTRGWIWD